MTLASLALTGRTLMAVALLTLAAPPGALAQPRGRVPTIRNRVATLEGRVASLEAQVATLQAQAADVRALQAAVAALQSQVAVLQASPLQALAPFVRVEPEPLNGLAGPHILLTGTNLHLRSGSGATDETPDATVGNVGAPRGLGNLVVGYNEGPTTDVPPLQPGDRGGSHNVILGPGHRYSSVGGLVAGRGNQVRGAFATVSGGNSNVASGGGAAVSGGTGNTASGEWASVSGGAMNTASGVDASVSGGLNRAASAEFDWVAGGQVQDD